MECPGVAAFEAAAALDAYEDGLQGIRRFGAHPGRIAMAQRELRRACTCCMALPQLSVASVALLLAHHRLFAELALSTSRPPRIPQVANTREVDRCLGDLQRACRELFLSPRLH